MKIKNKFWTFAILFSLIFIVGQGCEKNFSVQECENYGEIDGSRVCVDSLYLSGELQFEEGNCDEFRGELKNKCEKSFSEEFISKTFEDGSRNVEFCNNLILDQQKISCIENYYFIQAKNNKDSGYCNSIENPKSKEACLDSYDK